jgi:hypothetical protein
VCELFVMLYCCGFDGFVSMLWERWFVVFEIWGDCVGCSVIVYCWGYSIG